MLSLAPNLAQQARLVLAAHYRGEDIPPEVVNDAFIDAGWKNPDADPLRRQFVYFATSYGDGAQWDSLCGHTLPADPREFAVVVAETPLGDWSAWQPFGDCQKTTRDMLRTFLVLRPMRGMKPGDVYTEVRPGYYREILGAEGHDYCPYCGGDNGINGCRRHGWDCCYCGGN